MTPLSAGRYDDVDQRSDAGLRAAMGRVRLPLSEAGCLGRHGGSVTNGLDASEALDGRWTIMLGSWWLAGLQPHFAGAGTVKGLC